MGGPEVKTLTGLRGYAALGVCIFHYTLPWTDYDHWAMPLAQHGNYGVVVFFVLSGFIMLHVYRSWFDCEVTAAHYGRFMWHRFARIYPLHILLLFATAALIATAWMQQGPFNTPFTFVLNVLLIQGWVHPHGIALSWNAPAWTISIEFFLYMLFPFLTVVVRRTFILTLCGLVALVILGGGYRFGLMHYSMLFVLGAVTCEMFHRARTSSSWPFDAIVLAAGGSFIWWVFAGSFKPYSLPCLASAALIFGLCREGPIARWLVGNPVAVFLGRISYALYLSHGIVFAMLTTLTVEAMTGRPGSIGSALGRPVAELPLSVTVAIAIVVATALRYGFEQPVRLALRALRPAVKGAEIAIPGRLALRA